MAQVLNFPPPRYTPCSCPCCRACRFDHEKQQCVYGGPFTGYVDSQGRTLT